MTKEYKYKHPGMTAPSIDIRLWEIRHQLELNLELMERVCPVDEMTMKLFGHPLEMAQSHVYDRLDELEELIDLLKITK